MTRVIHKTVSAGKSVFLVVTTLQMHQKVPFEFLTLCLFLAYIIFPEV